VLAKKDERVGDACGEASMCSCEEGREREEKMGVRCVLVDCPFCKMDNVEALALVCVCVGVSVG